MVNMQSFSTKCLGLRIPPFSVHHQCPLATSSRYYNSENTKTHYEELGVSENATSAEIKKAFINKSKELHPDVNPQDPDLHKAFVKISAAYNTLSNPTSRLNYDVKLNNSYSAPSSSYSYSAGSPFGTRNVSHYYTNHNRSHASNKFHQPPVRQTPLKNPYNKYVVAGVLMFMFTGAVVHYVVINLPTDNTFIMSSSHNIRDWLRALGQSEARYFRHQKFKAHVEETSRKANLAYVESKERARSNGVQKQLELLMALHAQPASSTLQQVSEVSSDSDKNT